MFLIISCPSRPVLKSLVLLHVIIIIYLRGIWRGCRYWKWGCTQYVIGNRFSPTHSLREITNSPSHNIHTYFIHIVHCSRAVYLCICRPTSVQCIRYFNYLFYLIDVAQKSIDVYRIGHISYTYNRLSWQWRCKKGDLVLENKTRPFIPRYI